MIWGGDGGSPLIKGQLLACLPQVEARNPWAEVKAKAEFLLKDQVEASDCKGRGTAPPVSLS